MTEAEEECVWCDRALAIFGLVLGAGLVLMSLDLLGRPGLSNILLRGRRLASVIDFPAADEPPAS